MSQVAVEHGQGHEHDHPPFLAHHFDTPAQQFSSGKLGMWLFLATEVLLFGGLFCAYTIFRVNHPEIYEYGAGATMWQLGALNTVILIASSVTMAAGVTAAQRGQNTLLKVMLICTLMGGAGFMIVKYFEYAHKMHEGLFWASQYNPVHHVEGENHDDGQGDAGAAEADADSTSTSDSTDEAEAETETGTADAGQSEEVDDQPWTPYEEATVAIDRSQYVPSATGEPGLAEEQQLYRTGFDAEDAPQLTKVYFSIYYGMTGLHGLHVLFGMGVITWILVRAFKGHFGPDYFTPVDLGGLYWHLVDLIWIFLFPLLYLI